jgi:hypothetical protein
MRYLCIHGHFYQPPRENAWLETIEKQHSAHPFHDWNQRINKECYGPNRAARQLNEAGKIKGILNNYAYLSFNFGPTLLSWLEKNDPRTYQFIQQADRDSIARLGKGNAMAQVYNHMIMPLANRRDKTTQVLWGKRDFEYRFGRPPEGMWLAETAVDLETLEIMVDAGIQFVVLAPRQAKGRMDPTLSYQIQLPNHKSIRVFFYHGPLSQALAFEGLLNDGKKMAHALMRHSDAGSEGGLLHIATDGESYGHHHRFGEMALASCLEEIIETPGYALVNYAWYTANFPPAGEILIHENSSWSCEHGVERWRSHCGCKTGGEESWTQHWRGPLREALDHLRDRLNEGTASLMQKVFNDPLAARNDYIKLLLSRSPENKIWFFNKYKVAQENQILALRCMELQRNLMLMYTSCAWFFNEVSEIETTQVMQYALRALQYGEKIMGHSLLEEFSSKLAKAPSNKALYGDARKVFERVVLPKMLTLEKVAMHMAALCLFESLPAEKSLFNYSVVTHTVVRHTEGEKVLAAGRITIQSVLVDSQETFSFLAGYWGIEDLWGMVGLETAESSPSLPSAQELAQWMKGSPPEILGLWNPKLEGHSFSMHSLFAEQREKIYQSMAEKNKQSIFQQLQSIYDQNAPLAALALKETHALFPPFKAAAQALFNEKLEVFLAKDSWTEKEKRELLDEKQRWELSLLDPEKYRLLLEAKLLKDLDHCLQHPEKTPWETVLERLIQDLAWAEALTLSPELWALQNRVFSLWEKQHSASSSPHLLLSLGFGSELLKRAHPAKE